MTLRNVEDHFNRRLQYPYVIITEMDPPKELLDKAAYITGNRTTFGKIFL